MEYYKSGNILRIIDQNVANNSVDYNYDALSRLQDAAGPYGSVLGYGYDSIGNATKYSGGMTREFDYSDPKKVVWSWNDQTMVEYEAVGNAQYRRDYWNNLWEFNYNGNNELTQVYKNGELQFEMAYDQSGQRIIKVDHRNGQAVRTYYIGGSLEVEVQADGSRSETVLFYANGEMLSKHTQNNTDFYHHNHQGSTELVTNGGDLAVAIMVYYPFGEVLDSRSYGQSSVEKGYTGQQKDEGMGGLMYYNARYYDPQFGRLLTADSIVPDVENPQSFNRYSYVYNNPI